jgi:hypothetical protein
VYLFRVVEELQAEHPNAKMPTVLFPAAEPQADVAVDAVAAPTTSPE